MSTPLQRLAYLRLAEALPDLVPSTHVGPAPDRVESTGSSVIEILDAGPFAHPRNTGSYRVLHVNILSDRSRDEDDMPVRDDADTRAWMLYDRLNGLFHDLDHDWDEVHYSCRSDGPTLTSIPDGDGSVMLTVRYEVCLD